MMKETKIIVDDIAREREEQDRRFWLALPHYINEIFDRLDRLEKEIKELKDDNK